MIYLTNNVPNVRDKVVKSRQAHFVSSMLLTLRFGILTLVVCGRICENFLELFAIG